MFAHVTRANDTLNRHEGVIAGTLIARWQVSGRDTFYLAHGFGAPIRFDRGDNGPGSDANDNRGRATIGTV